MKNLKISEMLEMKQKLIANLLNFGTFSFEFIVGECY